MERIQLIRTLDQEIARLRQARTLLAGTATENSHNKGRRRSMSAEARRRISEAQKKRWAARKKGAK